MHCPGVKVTIHVGSILTRDQKFCGIKISLMRAGGNKSENFLQEKISGCMVHVCTYSLYMYTKHVHIPLSLSWSSEHES